jgi:iron complex transport system substrate-binding protein
VSETPRRIISLAPNITEILFALGLGDRMAGVTRYCDYPPAALAIEKVGGLLDPDLEKIRSLRPDLVIAFRGNPWDAVDRLRGLGLRVFVLDIGKTLADVPRTIENIGRVTLREKEAAALVRSLEDKAQALSRVLDAAGRKPKVFIDLQGLGLSTCGGGSYLNDLLERARGVNVAAAIRRDWLEYDRERLIQDDPDIILVMARTDADFARTRIWFETQGGLKDIRAVRAGRVLRLDENAASRFGPRLYDALAELARLLHPDLIK